MKAIRLLVSMDENVFVPERLFFIDLIDGNRLIANA